MKKPSSLLMLLAFCLPGSAWAQGETISGQARAQGPDILIIKEQRIILWGIDGPEPGQTCQINDQDWTCDTVAKELLASLIAGINVSCNLVGDPDPYGRRFGVCKAGDQDINAAMVKEGMALADKSQTDDYLDEQQQATADKKGLWQDGVEFIEPWTYRKITTNTPEGMR